MSGQCCCHKLQVLRACTRCLDRCTCHDGIRHWTLHIAHRTHGTFDSNNGGHIGHGRQRTAGKAVTIRSACPTGTHTTNCWTRRRYGSLPSTVFPHSPPNLSPSRSTRLVGWQPSDQVLTNWSTRLAARSVAFFIGHIVKHVVHTCKHILQSNIGQDMQQYVSSRSGFAKINSFPCRPCRTSAQMSPAG